MRLSLEYIAGLIDGEGYIGLWKRSNGGYQTGIKIAMVNADELLEELQSRFGGYIEHRVAKQVNHRNSSCWSLRNKTQVAPFLIQIMPHLRLKTDQAELLLEYCSLGYIHPLAKDTSKVKRANEIYIELKALKWKSPATTE